MCAKSNDRRLVSRVARNIPILVWGAGGHSGLTGFTRDVSSSGVFFFVPSWPHASARIEFILLLPPDSTSLDCEVELACRGKAIRIEQPRADGMIGVAAEIEDFRLRTIGFDSRSSLLGRELWDGLRNIQSFAIQKLRSARLALARIRSPRPELPPTTAN
jgi:hypothetical protein